MESLTSIIVAAITGLSAIGVALIAKRPGREQSESAKDRQFAQDAIDALERENDLLTGLYTQSQEEVAWLRSQLARPTGGSLT